MRFDLVYSKLVNVEQYIFDIEYAKASIHRSLGFVCLRG